jgi:glyoxylase-like metal-dependent hydrolase (beta-lactamase superfamily II)
MRRNPLGKTFSYLLEESKTLIDTGIGTTDAFQGLKRELNKHDLRPQDIERIIVTHLHHDHIGLIENFHRFNTKVYASKQASEREKELQELWNNMYDFTEQELKLFGGAKYLNYLKRYEYAFKRTLDPLPIDLQLEDGQTLKLPGIKLEVIWTPGHAVEHICLYDPDNKILFSGDHVLPRITSHISLHTYQKADPLNDYLMSLEKIKNLETKTILPGHEHIFHTLKDRIKELKNHHELRLNEMKTTLKNGPKTVYQIGSNVHWDSKPWPQMSFWTKRMAAAETYAHLIYLKNKKEIKEEQNHVLKYCLINAKS